MEFEQASENLVPVTPAPPKRGSRALAVSGIIGVLAVGGGAFALSRILQTGSAQPLGAIPTGADVVVTLDLEALASERTKDFVNTLSAAFDEDPNPDPMQQMIDGFDAAISKELGITFSDDIAPLLGKQAAFALMDVESFDSGEPPVLMAIAVRDDDRVDTFLARLEDSLTLEDDPFTVSDEQYAGTELRIWTFSDGTAVIAHIEGLVLMGSTKGAVTAGIDAYGDQASMEEDLELTKALEATPDAAIRVFVGQLPAVPAGMDLGPADQVADSFGTFEYAAVGVGITQTGLQMDVITAFDETKLSASDLDVRRDTGFIPGLPSDTLGYLLSGSNWMEALPLDDPALEAFGIDLYSISSELGFHPIDDFFDYLTSGFGISTTGITTDPSGFGVLFSALVSDPGRMAETLNKLTAYLKAQQVPVEELTVEGQEFHGVVDGSGSPIVVFGLNGDRLLVSSGSSALEGFLSSEPKLSSGAAYQAARLAAGGELDLFVDTQAVVTEVAGVMDWDEQELARLAPLGPIGMHSSQQSGEGHFRLVWLVGATD